MEDLDAEVGGNVGNSFDQGAIESVLEVQTAAWMHEAQIAVYKAGKKWVEKLTSHDSDGKRTKLDVLFKAQKKTYLLQCDSLLNGSFKIDWTIRQALCYVLDGILPTDSSLRVQRNGE